MAHRLFWLFASCAVPAFAQVHVDVQVALPTIVFPAPPPLVVVEPGVQVVADLDDEVFFVDGWYWCRRGAHWFRAKDHRGGWVLVRNDAVPALLVKVPPGKYKHWKKHLDLQEKGKGKHKGKK